MHHNPIVPRRRDGFFCIVLYFVFDLTHQGGTAGLNGLNLVEGNRVAAEALRELGKVEEDAVGGSDRAKLGTRGAANASLSTADGLLERTVLLGMVAVGAEGGVARRAAGREALGEVTSGRSRVRLGRVVDGRRN